jgi:hypothetical protein
LAAATELGGANTILDLETGAVKRELDHHPNGEVRALSRDGQWAATFGWHSDRMRLWNLMTGQMVREWVLGKRTLLYFTPDSRAVVLSKGDEFSLWDLETLQPVYRLRREIAQLPGAVAFSPDGRLMAIELAPAVLTLTDVATGRTVAKLEDPYGDRATSQGFTPDGTQLVVVAAYAGAVHVWDLRSIRTRLRSMGLDWDWPEFSEPSTTSVVAEPISIEIAPIDPGWLGSMVDQRARREIVRQRSNVHASPNSAQACNSLAWTLLTAPDALREVTAAVPLAERAVRLAPGNSNFRNTLGLGYYRASRFREAVQLLRPDPERPWDRTLAYDLLFLAMSYQRLGESARARDCYDSAVLWATLQRGLDGMPPGEVDELASFRSEAEQVLGIARRGNNGGMRPMRSNGQRE